MLAMLWAAVSVEKNCCGLERAGGEQVHLSEIGASQRSWRRGSTPAICAKTGPKLPSGLPRSTSVSGIVAS